MITKKYEKKQNKYIYLMYVNVLVSIINISLHVYCLYIVSASIKLKFLKYYSILCCVAVHNIFKYISFCSSMLKNEQKLYYFIT